jgi:hypothetical protein
MRKILFILIVSLLCSCAGKKKLVRTLTTTKGWIEYVQASDSKSIVAVDTSKLDAYEVTYSKTEYYPPETHFAVPSGQADNLATTTGQTRIKQPPDVQGAVKSVITYTLKRKQEQKGLSNVSTETKTDLATVSDLQETEQAKARDRPVFQLQYVFYILLLFAAGLLYFKRKTILQKLLSLWEIVLKLFT